MTALSSHPFTPPKLSAYVDEAKRYAAEHTLQTLGIPTEGGDAGTTAPTATSATVFPGTGERGSVKPETAGCRMSGGGGGGCFFVGPHADKKEI